MPCHPALGLPRASCPPALFTPSVIICPYLRKEADLDLFSWAQRADIISREPVVSELYIGPLPAPSLEAWGFVLEGNVWIGCRWKTSTYWAVGQEVLPNPPSFMSTARETFHLGIHSTNIEHHLWTRLNLVWGFMLRVTAVLSSRNVIQATRASQMRSIKFSGSHLKKS